MTREACGQQSYQHFRSSAACCDLGLVQVEKPDGLKLKVEAMQ
jgi:hypothetical protein